MVSYPKSSKAWREKNWARAKLWNTWKGMIARCHTPEKVKKRGWRPKDYADAGITVCKRWRTSFQHFCVDMGNPPTREHTLDRKNPSGNYTRSNCRWATASEQANNRTTTVLIEAPHPESREVIKVSVAEWARLTGLKPGAIYKRLKRGWCFSRAVVKVDRDLPF